MRKFFGEDDGVYSERWETIRYINGQTDVSTDSGRGQGMKSMYGADGARHRPMRAPARSKSS